MTRFLSILLALLAGPAALAQTCTTEWAAPADGAGEVAANWTGGEVPGPGDVACITVAGTHTIASGVYVVRFIAEVGGQTTMRTRRMVVVR